MHNILICSFIYFSENVGRLKKLEYLNLALNNVELIENLEGNFNSFLASDIFFHLASDIFCHLLIAFANSLDLDQDPQNVRPDLDLNHLTL